MDPRLPDRQERGPGAGPKAAMAMEWPESSVSYRLSPQSNIPVPGQWASLPFGAAGLTTSPSGALGKILTRSNTNTDWHKIHSMEPVKRDEEGLWRSSEATGQAGLDPRSRQMLDDEIPNLTEQEERRRIDAKSLDIEEWRSQAGGPLYEEEDISTRSFFESSPFQSSYKDRNIDFDEGYNVSSVGSECSDHQNRLLEGQIYYSKKVQHDADLKLLALPRHWHDAPSLPYSSTTALQPRTSNEATMRWNLLSDNISIASRAATCGSYRRRLSEPSEYQLDTDTFVERVPDLPNTEETRGKKSFFNQGLDRLDRLDRLANIVRKRSDSKNKRVRSSEIIDEETGNQLHGKYDSQGTLAAPSRSPRRGLSSINTALAAMAGPFAAVGESPTGIGPLSPRSPRSPHLTVRKATSRASSKSDMDLHDRSAQTGLAALWKPHGGPPIATLSSGKPSMGSEDEDEDEDENEEVEEIKEVDLSRERNPIVPNYEGFKEHVLRLNPDMDPRNKWLVSRIAHQQEIRYKNLLEIRVKHSQAIQARNCPAGPHCLTLGGAATSLDKEKQTAFEGLQIVTDFSTDDSSPRKGALTEETFPPGIPMPPTQNLPAEFECQLCFKAKKFQKPSDWIKHVHQDVQSFTCTYEKCKEPKSFKRSADWVRHENERHRHLEWWICQYEDCRHPCYRKDNFLQHLIREHKLPEPKQKTKSAIKKTDLTEPAWVMLESCHHVTTSRPQDEPCKFCGNAFPTWKELNVHLAKHMENISLPILRLVEQRIVDANTIISPVEHVITPLIPTRALSTFATSSKVYDPFGMMDPNFFFEKGRQSKAESVVAPVNSGFGSDDYDNLSQMDYTQALGLARPLSYSTSDEPRLRSKSSITEDYGMSEIPPTSPPPYYIHSPINSSKSGQMIRASVLRGLSDGESVHAFFTIYWDLRAFIRHQYEHVPISIGSIITLSGSAVAAQATTCQDYVHANWPIYGSRVLLALQEAFDSSDNVSTSNSPGLSVCINLADPVVSVDVKGFKETVVEVAQLFAWMGAAMRVSSSQQLQYSDFKLDTAAQGKFQMNFDTAPLEKGEQSCWYPLFVNPVIARGFPIPAREHNEAGLELPLELMAVLAGARYAVEYEGGLLLKGPLALCVPIKCHENSIQWHFIHRDEPATRMAYSEVKTHCPQRALLDEVTQESLQSTRAFVGWWKASRTYLGTNDYDYTATAYSTAAMCSRNVKLVGGALGFSKMGIGMNISLGAKDSRLFLSRAGPMEQIMQWAEMMPILLYDVTDKRGWFVKASDVILHIIQTRHSKRPFQIDGKVVPLLGADPELNGDEASERAIMQMSPLKLFKDGTKRDKEYYFADLVSDIWALLEVLSEVQNTEDMTPGKTIQGTLQVKIQGWEFMALVDQKSPLQRKEAVIEKTSGGWQSLIHDVNAVVLFAQQFGDIIRLTSSPGLCARWRLLPKGKDYMAAGVPLLKKLCEEAGSSSPYLHLTPTKLQWHRKSMLFEDCQGNNDKSKACHCDRLQQVVAKSSLNFSTINPPMNLEDRGCVIFGKSQQASRTPQPPTPVTNGLYNHPNDHIVSDIYRKPSLEIPISYSDDSMDSSPESYSAIQMPPPLKSAHIHIQGCEGLKGCQCAGSCPKIPRALEDCFTSASSLIREGKSFDRTQKLPVQQHDIQIDMKPSTKRNFNVHEDPPPSKKRAHVDKTFSPASEYERALGVDPSQDLLALPITNEEQKLCTVQIVENPNAFRRVVPADQAIRSESPKPASRRSW
ncbi:hypothetical protein BGZ57DRAFT_964852 [Hyaloscypha finlandica]|nr:hypothetical protein BGZ57DRAFT_964852 [Hyaloscypha finlandica]